MPQLHHSGNGEATRSLPINVKECADLDRLMRAWLVGEREACRSHNGTIFITDKQDANLAATLILMDIGLYCVTLMENGRKALASAPDDLEIITLRLMGIPDGTIEQLSLVTHLTEDGIGANPLIIKQAKANVPF